MGTSFGVSLTRVSGVGVSASSVGTSFSVSLTQVSGVGARASSVGTTFGVSLTRVSGVGALLCFQNHALSNLQGAGTAPLSMTSFVYLQ